MKHLSSIVLLILSIAVFTGCDTYGIQSDPQPSGGYLSYLVPLPGEGQPLGETFPTPTIEVGIEPVPTEVPCWGVVTANPQLRVRSGPGFEHSVVNTVRWGITVDVIGQTDEWLEIVQPPGWVSRTYVQLSALCD